MIPRASSLALLALAATCVPLAPVPRDPWIEDPSLALAHEVLVLRVRDDRVDVDAAFRFETRRPAAARVMTFPIGHADGPASAFRATVERAGATPAALPVAAGDAGLLPVGPAAEHRTLSVPADALGGGAILRVRYTQPASCGFDYVLRSGAYWRGPLGDLRVIVSDPGGRVLGARVEGRSADRRVGSARLWRLVGTEPEGGVTLTLRCPAQEARGTPPPYGEPQ